jgi:hypothetical protein
MTKEFKQLKMSGYLLCISYLLATSAFGRESRGGITLIELPTDIPIIDSTEMPGKLVVSKIGADDEAKSKISAADQLKKRLSRITFSERIKEAYNLYDAAASAADVSADLRGRAKINAAELYPYANTDDSSYSSIQQRKIESLKLFIDIIEEKSYSADVRGWAKCRLAKLYVENTFDAEPAVSKQKALDLLQEVSADKDVGIDIKAHAKIQLATAYSQKLFDVSEADARLKADGLFNEVRKDAQVSIDLKAKASFGLAELKNIDDDPHNAQQLKTLKEISVEPTYSASIQAKAKAKIARRLLNNEFDSKPSELYPMALALYKEILNEPKPDAKADAKLDPAERFEYKHELALRLAKNAFHQKTKEAKDAAQVLYKELLDNNVSIYTDQKTIVKWNLALHYLEKRLDPPAGKDSKTAGMDLITEILNDSHVNFELLLLIKLNVARLYHFSIVANPFGLPAGQAKDEALRILNDLLGDSRLSGKQKEMVQNELDRWNGVVRRA